MLYRNPYQSFPTTYLLTTPQAFIVTLHCLHFPNQRQVVPEKERRFLEVRRHVADWIDNKRKTLRNLGQEYKSRDGTTRHAKTIKPMCLEKCRQKCSWKISNVEIIAIFNQF